MFQIDPEKHLTSELARAERERENLRLALMQMAVQRQTIEELQQEINRLKTRDGEPPQTT